MSSHSRIAQEHSSNLSSLATHRGIEHEMAVEEDSGYVTFEFTTPRSKRAFDLLCAENGVDVDRGRIVNLMLDAIVEGASPSEVLEKYSAKKLQVTQGMANAFRKRPKYSCSSCGLAIPKYTGGYPRSCPNCNGDLSETKSSFHSNLNRSQAIRIDKSKHGGLYAEKDSEYGWCVFGSESGFCYEVSGSEADANRSAKKLAREIGLKD